MASLINHTQGVVAPCLANTNIMPLSFVCKTGFCKARLCKAKVPKGLTGFDKSKWSISMSNYKKEKAIIFVLNEPNYEEVSYADNLHSSDQPFPLRTHDDNYSSIMESPYENNPSASNLQSFQRSMEGILEMSRLQNFVPLATLVLIGAWLGGGRSMEVLLRPSQVWIAVWCSSLISIASMLVNDIFDFRSGTDQANGKTNPLLRGELHPYHVELVAISLYGVSIIGLCFLEPMSLRLIVGLAIVTTYIYTPILKQIMVVKNMVVSGIISSAVFLGALATTGTEEQLQNPIVIGVALFIFLCFLSREILMDVRDIEGDKATGVNTVAVFFGGQLGTLIASLCLATANALLIGLLATKSQTFATIGTLILLPLHVEVLSLWKELRTTKESLIVKSIDRVVQHSMVHIGFGALVLAFMA